MQTNITAADDWALVAAQLPADLDGSARRFGALRRKRAFTSGEGLVRLALAYALGQRSLRATATWAEQVRLAVVSDVAVLKRLRASADWLGHLLTDVLLARAGARAVAGTPYRLRIVDATTVQRPGSRGTDWRVHVSLDLATVQVDTIEVTDAQGGEHLSRYPIRAGDLVLGDRGLAHRRGLHAVTAAGGDVLVRLTWQNLPLQTPAGTPFDLLGALRGLDEVANASSPTRGEWAVQTAPAAKDGVPAIPGRVVALRHAAATAAEARRRVLAQARKKGRTPSAQTLEAAGYCFIFTTVPSAVLPADAVLALYRFRWQIELLFKRHKSLLHLDALVARDPVLCRTFLYANLLGGVLVEGISQSVLDLSPPPFRPRPAPQSLAADPSDGGDPPPRPRPRPTAARVALHGTPDRPPLSRPTTPSPVPSRRHPRPRTPLSGVISA